MDFLKKTNPENLEKKEGKKVFLKNLCTLSDGREKVLDALSVHSRLKKLTSKQILLRLPIALAQVKAGNASKNLLNEIRQIT